jgi:U3 small nucleolar RNA-associated protein 10
MDDSKFTKLLDGILNQFELVDRLQSDYLELISKFIVPCLTELALFTKEESQRKQINKLLCLKSRSKESEIRLVSVLALKEIYKRVGEPMLTFFPETIPFIAELMEDEELEDATQDLCLVIQDHLGEPIQQYFSQ